MGKKHSFLGFFAILFTVFATTTAFAAGYTCDPITYTECAEGFYMTASSSSNTWDDSQNSGNACKTCPDEAATCPGGTDAPVYSIEIRTNTDPISVIGYYSASAGYCTNKENCVRGGSAVVEKFSSLPYNTKQGATFNGYYKDNQKMMNADGTPTKNASDLSGLQVWSPQFSDCPAGYYCNGLTPNAQEECEAGYYCPGGSSSPTKCEAGHYCPNASTQIACPAEYPLTDPNELRINEGFCYTDCSLEDVVGASRVSGRNYKDNTKDSCIAEGCNNPYYLDNSTCKTCPDGGRTNASGPADITYCFRDDITYKSGHATGTQRCHYDSTTKDYTNCTYSGYEKYIKITGCAAGYQYKASQSTTDCVPVEDGFYSEAGEIKATQCPDGYTTSSSGQGHKSIYDCYKQCPYITNAQENPYKLYYPNTTCQITCKQNTYLTTKNGEPSCNYCPTNNGKRGYTETAGAIGISKCLIDQTETTPDGHTCTKQCYFQSESSLNCSNVDCTITSCRNGTYKTDAGNCDTCPAGKYCANNEQYDCPDNGLIDGTGNDSVTACYKTYENNTIDGNGETFTIENGQNGTKTCFFQGDADTGKYTKDCTITINKCTAGYWYDANQSTTDCVPVSSGYFSTGEGTSRQQCPDGYENSNPTATSDTECYTQCTTNNIDNSTAVTGWDYYGDGNDSCKATGCNQDYFLTDNNTCTQCINEGNTKNSGANHITDCYKTLDNYTSVTGNATGTRICKYETTGYTNCTYDGYEQDIEITWCADGYWHESGIDCTAVGYNYFSPVGVLSKEPCPNNGLTNSTTASDASACYLENQLCEKNNVQGTTTCAFVIEDNDYTNCEECNISNCLAGTYLDDNSCKQCEGNGFYCANNVKTECPASHKNSATGAATQYECYAICPNADNKIDYYDDDNINTCQITCESGTYLPAGADKCAQCLNDSTKGYYCNGGTFDYNAEIDQGLDSCADLGGGVDGLFGSYSYTDGKCQFKANDTTYGPCKFTAKTVTYENEGWSTLLKDYYETSYKPDGYQVFLDERSTRETPECQRTSAQIIYDKNYSEIDLCYYGEPCELRSQNDIEKADSIFIGWEYDGTTYEPGYDISDLFIEDIKNTSTIIYIFPSWEAVTCNIAHATIDKISIDNNTATCHFTCNEGYKHNTNSVTGDQGVYEITGECAQNLFECTPGQQYNGAKCESGYFCPGGNVTSIDQCQQSCPKGYTSEAGETSNTKCYKYCDINDFANATEVTGIKYYGTGSNTCEITKCKDNYSISQDKQSCEPNTYNITLNKNGGNGTTADSILCTYNESCIIPVTNDLSRTGYSFNHQWCTENNGTGTCYDAGNDINVTDDMTLYAKWTPMVFKVNLNTQDVDGLIPTNNIQGPVYLKYNTGWYKDPDATIELDNITKLGTDLPQLEGYIFGGYELNGTTFINGLGYLNNNALTIVSTNDESATAIWSNGNITCTPGYYYPGTGNTCTECPENHYCHQEISVSTNNNMATGLTPCDDNGRSAPGANSANLCYKTGQTYTTQHAKGTQTCYFDGTDYNDCKEETIEITWCTGGYWYKSGIDCTAVAQGYFSPDGNIDRQPCPQDDNGTPGTTGGTAAMSSTECYITNDKCGANGAAGTQTCHYNTDSGKYDNCNTCHINSCPAGTYLENDTCKDCPAGYYCNNNNITACEGDRYTQSDVKAENANQCFDNCIPDDVTNSTSVTGTIYRDGSNDCQAVACAAGYYMDNGECKECPDGKYCDPNSNNGQPQECPANSICNPETGEITSCDTGYEQQNDTCQPCNRNHAVSYKPGGNCIITECEANYHPSTDGMTCETNTRDCTNKVENAESAFETWNDGKWGECTIETCSNGYHLINNKCSNNSQTCDLPHGAGTQIWDTTNNRWGECIADKCNPGYEKNGNSCKECKNMYTYFDGKRERAVSTYTTGCTIGACMYQGELFALDQKDDTCKLICTGDDTTGSRKWNPQTKRCEHTCTAGYTPWGDAH